MNRFKHFWQGSTAVGILLLLPAITQDPYFLFISIQVFLWGTMAATLFLTIRTGIFNLGHAAFMAIGAYVTALLMTREAFSFWLTLPIAGAGAAAFAAFVGIPILRVKGMYFVLLTCALCEVVKLLIANFPTYTGGYNGVWGIPSPRLAGIDFNNKVAFYYLVLIFMVSSIAVCYRIWNSYIGRVFRAIAENEMLCRSVGVPTSRYKLLSFVIASFFAALCGSFLATLSGTIDPLMFGLGTSVNVFLYMVLGGIRSILGPPIGAAVAILVFEQFRFMLELTPAVLGGVVIAIIIFLPDGLISAPGAVAKVWLAITRSKRQMRVKKEKTI